MTRMISGTNSAKKAFNELGLEVDGSLLTFSRFNSIARKDMYKALNLLSGQMDVLSENTDVLRRMFTQRQWTQISSVLQEIDGDVEGFVETLTTGKSTAEGFATQMDSLSNKIGVLTDNFKELKGDVFDTTKILSSGLIPILNKLMDALTAGESVAGKTGRTFIALGGASAIAMASVRGLYLALTEFKSVTTGFAGMGTALTNPWVLGISAIVAGLGAMYYHIKKTEQVRQAAIDDTRELQRENDKLKKSIESNMKQVEKYNDIVEDGIDYDIAKPWSEASDQIDLILEKSKRYQDIAKSLSKIDSLDFSVLQQERPQFNYVDTYEGIAEIEKKIKSIQHVEGKIYYLKQEREDLDLGLIPSPIKTEDQKRAFEIGKEIIKLEKFQEKYASSKEQQAKSIATLENEILKLKQGQSDAENLHADAQGEVIENAGKYLNRLRSGLGTLNEETVTALFQLDPSKEGNAEVYTDYYADIFDEVASRTGETFEGIDEKLDVLGSTAFDRLKESLSVYVGVEDDIITTLFNSFNKLNISMEDLKNNTGILEDYNKALKELEKSEGWEDLTVDEKSAKKQKELLDLLQGADADIIAKGFENILGDNNIKKEAQKTIKGLISLLYAVKEEADKTAEGVTKLDGETENFSNTIDGLSLNDFKDSLRELEFSTMTDDLKIVRKELQNLKSDLDNLGEGDYKKQFNDIQSQLKDWSKSGKFSFDTMEFSDEDAYNSYKDMLEDLGIEEDKVKEILTIKSDINNKSREEREILSDRNEILSEYSDKLNNSQKTEKELIDEQLTKYRIRNNITSDYYNQVYDKYALDGKINETEQKILDLMYEKYNLTQKQNKEDKQTYQKRLKELEQEVNKRQKIKNQYSEIVNNLGKTELEILDEKLKKELGIVNINKEIIKKKLELFKTNDGKISESEQSVLDLMIEKHKKQEGITEEYKKQYDLLNQMNESAKFFGDMFGRDISGTVEPLTSIFGDNGSLSKFKTAKEGGNVKDQISAGAEIAGQAIDAFDNVYDGILQTEINNIDKQMTNLEMRKELATSEEERAKIDKQILEQQKAKIDLQTQQQTSGMVLGGIAQGASIGAAFGPHGAAIGGALGGIAGLFGKSQAEEQAEYQKEMLEKQAEQNRLIAYQTEITEKNAEANRKFYQEGSKFGSQYAGQRFNYTAMKRNNELSGGYKLGSGQNSYHRYTVDVPIESKKLEGESRVREYASSVRKMYENWKTITPEREKDLDRTLEKYEDYSFMTGSDRIYDEGDLVENYEEIREEIAEKVSSYKVAQSFTTTLKERNDELQKQVDILNKNREVFVKEWFGFGVEEKKDDEWQITNWNTRLDILNESISQSSENFTNLGSSIANAFSEGYINFYVKELSTLSEQGGLLDQLQNQFELFASFKSGVPMPIKGNNVNVGASIIKDIKNTMIEIEKEQQNINDASLDFVNELSNAGIKISNLKDQLLPGLYGEMTNLFKADSYKDGIDSIGNYLFDTIANKSIENILDDKFSKSIANLNNMLFNNMNEITISGAQQLMNEGRTMAMSVESSRQKMSTLQDILTQTDEIEYEDSTRNIQYETGTSQRVVNNYYNTVETNITDSIGFSDDAGYAIAQAVAPYLENVNSNR